MMRYLASFALVAACGTDIGSRPDLGEGSDGGAMADGGDLFREYCGRCHGMDGAGTPDGPQIQSPVHGYATYVVRTGRNEMGYPAPMEPFVVDELPDDELAAILGYLSSIPKPVTGPELFGRFCANCHGGDALGGRVEEAVAGEELDEVYEKVREGHGGTSYGSRTKYMPAWNSAELTDAEVDAIAAYLAALPKPPDDDDD